MQNPLGVTTEINLHAPSLLPDHYCNDIHERLVLYKRMANCESSDQLDDMYQELVDRFGLFPDPARTLLECHRLRIAARPLGISRIDATAESILVQQLLRPGLMYQVPIQLSSIAQINLVLHSYTSYVDVLVVLIIRPTHTCSYQKKKLWVQELRNVLMRSRQWKG